SAGSRRAGSTTGPIRRTGARARSTTTTAAAASTSMTRPAITWRSSRVRTAADDGCARRARRRGLVEPAGGPTYDARSTGMSSAETRSLRPAMTGRRFRIAAAVTAIAYIAIQGFQEVVFRSLGEPATPAEALALGAHPLQIARST